MTACLIEVFFREVGDVHLLISAHLAEFPDILVQEISYERTLGSKERKTSTHKVGKYKKVQLFAEFSVVTFLCFRKHL